MVSDIDSFFSEEIKQFEKLYPDIKEISIISERKGRGVDEFSRILNLRKGTFKEIIPCVNSCCNKGGFDIGREVSYMMLNNQTKKEIDLVCHGCYLGNRCWNSLKDKIEIKYKKVPKATGEEKMTKRP